MYVQFETRRCLRDRNEWWQYPLERPRHFSVTSRDTSFYVILRDEKIKKNWVALGRPPDDAAKFKKQKKKSRKRH
jgi:hypothetical protein